MNLVIDFGNTTGKAGLFKNNKLFKVIYPIDMTDISEIESEFEPENCIISSTSLPAEKIKENLKAKSVILSTEIKLPFKVTYKTPKTLGLDRIAAVAGAKFLYPDENLLVIDMGTCITYDLLFEGSYLGGAISPGLKMRFKALNTFTANLPLIEPEDDAQLVGDSTKTSILSGVVNGMVVELEGIISRYCDKYGELKVLICGGDYIFFENKLKASIFAAPELVLQGLNGILRYNV